MQSQQNKKSEFNEIKRKQDFVHINCWWESKIVKISNLARDSINECLSTNISLKTSVFYFHSHFFKQRLCQLKTFKTLSRI
jgi:hypothetical protein